VPVRRADVLRLVIERGMDALESERPTTEDKAGGKRRR
jgi:hypothetical protein